MALIYTYLHTYSIKKIQICIHVTAISKISGAVSEAAPEVIENGGKEVKTSGSVLRKASNGALRTFQSRSVSSLLGTIYASFRVCLSPHLYASDMGTDVYRVSTMATAHAWKKSATSGMRAVSARAEESQPATAAPLVGAASQETSSKPSSLRTSLQSKVRESEHFFNNLFESLFIKLF